VTAAVQGAIRRVETLMGTTVSIEVQPPLVSEAVLDEVFDQLHDIDARFSPFKPESEVSRLMRGELREEDASLDVRHVIAACDHLAVVTDGAFDARRHRSDGRLDPSGFVKGWAIEEAAWLIDSAGGRNYWINAGGDIVARGQAAPGRPWRVGIRHPDRADRVAAVLAVSDRAVATSGAYERGGHISDPRTGLVAAGLRSVTIVGRRLAFTDAYATAVFAMGIAGLGWLTAGADRSDYAAYAITDDGRAVWTEGMEDYLVRDSVEAGDIPGAPRGSGHHAAGSREAHDEARATLGAVRDLDPAAMAVDDPGGDGEAEPGSPTRSAGRAVEPLEQVRQVLRPDPRTVVFNDQ
jgi:thiamine biosynthesis lipoprotein